MLTSSLLWSMFESNMFFHGMLGWTGLRTNITTIVTGIVARVYMLVHEIFSSSWIITIQTKPSLALTVILHHPVDFNICLRFVLYSFKMSKHYKLTIRMDFLSMLGQSMNGWAYFITHFTVVSRGIVIAVYMLEHNFFSYIRIVTKAAMISLHCIIIHYHWINF